MLSIRRKWRIKRAIRKAVKRGDEAALEDWRMLAALHEAIHANESKNPSATTDTASWKGT